jgi:hypothetical protein
MDARDAQHAAPRPREGPAPPGDRKQKPVVEHVLRALEGGGLDGLDPQLLRKLPSKFHQIGCVLLLQGLDDTVASLDAALLRRIGEAYLTLPQLKVWDVDDLVVVTLFICLPQGRKGGRA